jgi:hypothetical protein
MGRGGRATPRRGGRCVGRGRTWRGGELRHGHATPRPHRHGRAEDRARGRPSRGRAACSNRRGRAGGGNAGAGPRCGRSRGRAGTPWPRHGRPSRGREAGEGAAGTGGPGRARAPRSRREGRRGGARGRGGRGLTARDEAGVEGAVPIGGEVERERETSCTGKKMCARGIERRERKRDAVWGGAWLTSGPHQGGGGGGSTTRAERARGERGERLGRQMGPKRGRGRLGRRASPRREGGD